MRFLRNNKGFTLIELLIVIIILGVLAALITGNFFTSLKKGRDARRKADIGQVQKALELYYEDKRAYPTQAPDPGFVFGEQFSDPSTGKTYMQRVATDPLGNTDYRYESDTDGTYYKLYACLENDQQNLPYLSSPTSYNCNKNCKDKDNNTIPCIWGISSANINP
ncbi:prepilin-type N-terminal cleavage/methylation domain-containing protein [Candidatus Roizmanbacteria bacterium]|nr:prepilin-type N-terminal cleavage/methylation domain-containing protein [Candidatus Roizmanbacteria bacterium]